jgi:predicted HD phosphohydrolase
MTSRSLDDVDSLFEELTASAEHRDGETINLLEHSLQCAQLLADRAADDPELQVAGLVHDLGTVLVPGRPATHAATGARAVRALLGDRVAELVGRHDEAKRYLVTVDRAYRDRLSDRSIETLATQGGALDDKARAAFEASEHFDSCIELRRCDDDAKVQNHPTLPLTAWRPVVERVVEAVVEAHQ